MPLIEHEPLTYIIQGMTFRMLPDTLENNERFMNEFFRPNAEVASLSEHEQYVSALPYIVEPCGPPTYRDDLKSGDFDAIDPLRSRPFLWSASYGIFSPTRSGSGSSKPPPRDPKPRPERW